MKKNLSLFILLIFTFCFLGCSIVGDGTNINYEVGYLEEPKGEVFEKKVELEIVKTYDEWKKLECLKDNLNLKYNESYFEKNIVIIYYFRTPTRGNICNVKNVLKKRQELIIEIEVIQPGFMDELSGQILILEISQKDGNKIKNVSILMDKRITITG